MGGTVPPVGTSGTAVRSVSEQWTAEALGSGSLPVFGTPALVALMEEAACVALQPFLGDSETSVGTGISTSHISATAVGSQVRACNLDIRGEEVADLCAGGRDVRQCGARTFLAGAPHTPSAPPKAPLRNRARNPPPLASRRPAAAAL